MQILLHEFVTGGGWHSHADSDPPESLLREGRAMLRAAAADLAAIPGLSLEILQDARFADDGLPGNIQRVNSADAERKRLVQLAAAVDGVMLIAPEFNGHLLERTRLVERAGGKLFCPTSQLVAL